MTDRRTALGGLAALSLAPTAMAVARVAPAPIRRDFLWGAATAAHQVEGNNVTSDVWLMENLPETRFPEPSGDACDHYHRFEADIAIISALGLNTYRFSIEWARVEPVEGRFSRAILAHYGRMLDACRRNGLTPVVTLHHFTSPAWFAAKGGFENDDAPALFTRYCTRVVEALGDRMEWVCTINEANLWFGDQPEMRAAAARHSGSAIFSTFLFADQGKAKPNVHRCHAQARAAIKALRPALRVGYTLAMDDYQDAPGSTGHSAPRRAAAYDPWLVGARQDDFIGIQTYSRTLFDKAGVVHPPKERMTQANQEFYPAAVGGTVRYAAAIARVPVLVTEYGVGHDDDRMRVCYIDGALAALQAAVADGIDLRGCIHWSLMDNFEWMGGYGPRFGLIAVDRTTYRRSPKPSAWHLGAIARANRWPSSGLR